MRPHSSRYDATRLKVITVLVSLFVALFARSKTLGQSAFDGFDPMTNGSVDAFAIEPDGKVLIGGSFTSVFGVPRNYIARLNADGTVDTAFNPNANSYVGAIALQSDGKILVGGSFQGAFSIGGQTRNRIARLDPITGAADSFNPNAGPVGSGVVKTIVVQPDGSILVGGTFTSIGGQMRSRIARLNPVTGLADSFDPNPHFSGSSEQYTDIDAIAVQRDGKILVGGFFETIGGAARNSLARLDPVTGLSDSFNPNTTTHASVFAIALQADDKILVGGGTFTIGGQTRYGIARIDPATALADSFNPNASASVDAIAVQPDGKILAVGSFAGQNSIGGQFRNLIARLDPITGLADSFDPNANQAPCCFAPHVSAVAVQSDGKVLVGGGFTGLKPNGGAQVTRTGFARLEKDGRVDQTLNASVMSLANFGVNTMVVQPDGKILIGGAFYQILGVARNRIARLNTDGSLDMTFNPNANQDVVSLAVQPDGKILAGGYFTTIGGVQRNYIARLDSITGMADTFNPNPSSIVYSLGLQADGKILVGGVFTTIGEQHRYHIARLDPTTGLADEFDPNPTDSAGILAVQPDGKIWIGGGFFGVGGQQRKYFARLDPVTGLPDSFNNHPLLDGPVTGVIVQPDGNVLVVGSFTMAGGQPRNRIALLDGTTGAVTPFNPNLDDTVQSVVLQANGKIVVGGKFVSIGGQVRRRIGRINLNTGLPDLFDPTADDQVKSIAFQPDGKILVGGDLVTIGGQNRNYFARLSNDDSALQELSVSRSNITWVRGGSSVQFARVTFEYSTDNANYSFLGGGTPAGSDWTLGGLNLPNAQSFYVRARGIYRTGLNNGSESIAESVRHVFLHEVSVGNIVSRKMHGGAGTFDINLPRTGNPGIECRNGGPSGDYQLIFSFANPINSVDSASLTSGIGSVSSRMIDTDAHNYIVNLTGVANSQLINVTLTNVNDSNGNSSSGVMGSMAVLIGDVDGNGAVNGTDVSQAKVNSGRSIDTVNFRSDIIANGSINASDVALVKANSGTGFQAGREQMSVSKP
jgi:uncharacterized delta-60 repeat protein